jgi:hypothetical protein
MICYCNNPKCKIGRTLCGSDTVELCYECWKLIIETNKIPEFILKWINKKYETL